MTDPATPSSEDLAAVEQLKAACDRLRADLSAVIVGQSDVIDQVLIAVLAGGHAMLEGVPGGAKSLLLTSLADAAQLSFRRIHCTPDLLASDIIGAPILQEDPESRRRHYQFERGPLFANLVMAENINYTPPKTQAALFDAMHDRQIHSAGQEYKLPEPWFVLATRNSLEQEDAHPLPAAQLDQFLLYIKTDYPKPADEWEIARRFTSAPSGKIATSLTGEDVLEMQRLVARLPVNDLVLGYAWALVRATRPGTPEAAAFVDKWVAHGAGSRGLVALITAAKARAVLHGRATASIADIQCLIKPALRHRFAGNFAAEASNLDSDRLIDILLEDVPSDVVYRPPMG